MYFNCFGSNYRKQRRIEKDTNKKIEKELRKCKNKTQNVHKLLLLGNGESGKSTILKQMKILHVNGFDKDECLRSAIEIRRNIRDCMITIIEAMDTLDPPIILENENNKDSLDYLKNSENDIEFDFSPKFFDQIKILLQDQGIIDTFQRCSEFQIMDCAHYFFEEINRISLKTFYPNAQDILHCRVLTKGIIETHFSIDKIKFHIFDMGGQRNERKKWAQCFDDVTAIIFVTSTSSYNLKMIDDENINKLQESISIFSDILSNRWLKNIPIILFLNKQDILKLKINSGCAKLENYFSQYKTYTLPNNVKNECGMNPNYVKAKYFIRDEFIKINNQHDSTHSCYPHFTCAVDTENIKRVFNDCRDIIRKYHMSHYELM